MTPQAKLISRLLNIFGEPKCDDPAAYIDEFEQAISGYAEDVLIQAGTEVIKRCTFWPRPAEVIGIIEEICRRREAAKPPPPPPKDLPPPTPEQVERSRQLQAVFKTAVRARTFKFDEPAKNNPMQRPEFEAMQRASRNTHLHVDHRALTRRITGERDE